MKVLLTTLNSKYVHSSLALKYLFQASKGTGVNLEVKEYTINNEYDYIFGELIRSKADVVVFSTYIWNVEMIKALCEDLHKARPEVKIVLGGPEVSFDAANFLKEYSWASMIIRGEGEETFKELCRYWAGQNVDLSSINGITYRNNKGIMENFPRLPMEMDKVPFPYEGIEPEKDKVIYFESSRGCPFRCSYCMSSIEKTIRPMSLERTKEQLQYFIDRKVRQVKFIDRTFNFDKKRAYELWKFLIEQDNGTTNFHFEICADLLDEKILKLLREARPGLFQLEIGIQSVNPNTLKAIKRSTNTARLMDNIRKLASYGNCHLHVDLIAGLPYEDETSFRTSFNQVYDLGAEELQLGFLKLLKGTNLYNQRQEHQLNCRSKAPYQIISNKYISADQLVALQDLERVLDIYHNRGGFEGTIKYFIESTGKTPYDFYKDFGSYYVDAGFHHMYHKKEDQYRILLAYGRACSYREGIDCQKVEELIIYDISSAMNEDVVKRFLKKGLEL